MTGHRLLILTPAQAERHLLQWIEGPGPEERDRLLQDRATAFWLCVQERERNGPRTHWALLPPRSSPLPRLHMVPSGGVGIPIQRNPEFTLSLDFASQSLRAHGALWIAWPVCGKEVDKVFGPGAWEEARQAEAEERAHAMEKRFSPPNACMAKDRL